LFDQYLADLAKKAGAQYHLQSRVESLAFERDFAKGVVVNREGSRETMPSEIVIDAEGISSALLKKAGLRMLDRSMVVNGAQAEVEGPDDLDEDTVEVYLGQKYAPGLFAWIIPRRDGSAKVGLKIISLCSTLGVNRILEEVGDLDFQGKSLIRVVRHPSVLAVTLYSLFSSNVSRRTNPQDLRKRASHRGRRRLTSQTNHRWRRNLRLALLKDRSRSRIRSHKEQRLF